MNLETKPCICFSDLLMTEIVDCFVVGHWAVSHKKLTERHVSRQMTNLVDVEVKVDGYPEELYESIIKTFSKEGDLVLDVGSENGKFGLCCFLQHVSNRLKYFAMPSCWICQHLCIHTNTTHIDRTCMCCTCTLGTPKIPSHSVGGCLEMKSVSFLFDLENIF